MSEYPSLSKQAKNLTQFASSIAQNAMNSGTLFVPQDVKQERLNICYDCEHYDPDQKRCKQCGCFLEHKTKFATGSCPINKWEKFEDATTSEIVQNNVNNMQQIDQSDHPRFPANPNIGDGHSWREFSWKWNGNFWAVILKE
jgi:hypothetical protein